MVKEFGVYQFLSSMQAKGGEVRLHIGMTVQRAVEVMTECGLNPLTYAFICHDEWNTTEEVTAEDEDGNISVVMPASEAGDRYGFRMDQLLAFISIGFATRLDDMENRLDAL